MQTGTVERNRKDSLQLLRIEDNLNSLGLAMRDIAEGGEPYPIAAWKSEFNRIRFDLDDALRLETTLSPGSRIPAQQNLLSASLARFWDATDRMFALALAGKEAEARGSIRSSLESQRAAIVATVARLLVQNNEAEEQTVGAIQRIYDRVERNSYLFLAAVLATIAVTGLYLIQANRRIFGQLSRLSDQRRVLARKLITMQEEILRSVSRELHDEFGQILTAVGAMLRRAETKGLPPDSPFRSELSEVREVAQSTLERLRSLSQTLRPTILDDYGLEKALEWYVREFEKQTGTVMRYEKQGSAPLITDDVAIHVYRILQEALNNVARHAASEAAWVRVQFTPGRVHLEVEDHGAGMPSNGKERASTGLGLIAMRERADLLRAKLEFSRPAEGGTMVSLDVPLAEATIG